MKELMSLAVQLERELLTTVRLATGGVCSLVGLNVEDSEDCKVCVTESLLLLLRSGYTSASVSFYEEEGLRVLIVGKEGVAMPQNSPEDEISCALLEALMPCLVMQKEDGKICSVQFTVGC